MLKCRYCGLNFRHDENMLEIHEKKYCQERPMPEDPEVQAPGMFSLTCDTCGHFVAQFDTTQLQTDGWLKAREVMHAHYEERHKPSSTECKICGKYIQPGMEYRCHDIDQHLKWEENAVQMMAEMSNNFKAAQFRK